MPEEKKKKFRPSLATSILIGLVLGILCGVFFGEYCSFLEIFGDGFIKLLQMTILPYIVVSLILGIGRMTFKEAKLLAAKAGILMLIFWGISFFMVLVMPLSFPEWETAAFFSTSLVEVPQKVDFLQIYIPANPFYALANNLVPAVVLFSILFGVVLMGIKEKDPLIHALDVAAEALIKVTNLIVKLTPYGVFAISAAAAGTMTVEEFGRLQVYFITFNLAALFLTFWVLPMLLTAVTPFKYKDVVGMSKDAMATAFTTGNLFVVLTVLTENCKTLFKKYDLAEERTDSYVDVIIPVSFNFPTTGKLLMLLFILFAAWFSGSSLSMKQYPTFIFSGLLSFFGGVDVAMPFMLDLLRLPADLYQLYVVTGILNGRFATLLAAMNLLVFTILATCALSGSLSINKKRVMNYVITTLVLTVAVVGGSRLYFSHFVKNEYTEDEALVKMHLLTRPVEAEVYTELPARPPYHDPNTSSLDRILARGTLRVGYTKDRLPYVFVNKKGQLVGFDIEMAHDLARELGVSLEFFLLERGKVEEQLNAGYCDIVMAGLRITPQKALKVTFSQPYLDETIAFVVKDHLRESFSNRQDLLKQESLRIGLIKDPYILDLVRSYLPQAKLVQLQSPRDFFRKKKGDLDALLFTAEAGSAWTLLYPEYTVVVPQPDTISIPLAYAIPRGDRQFSDFLNSWLALKKTDGTIEKLFNHWILGEGAKETKPRWSVIRNVLHWVK